MLGGQRTIDRPLLVRRVLSGQRVLITAPSGYGKTTLLGQVLERTAGAAVAAQPDDSTRVVMSRLVRSLSDSGLPQFAADESAPEQVIGSLERVHDPLLVAVDDAHLVGDGERLVEFLDAVPARHVAVAASRSSDGALGNWAAAGGVSLLGQQDLRFAEDEVDQLLQDRLQKRLDPQEVRVVTERAGGWVAAIDLAARRAASIGDAGDMLSGLVPGGSAVGRMVDAALEQLSDIREAVITLGYLPRCWDETAAALADRRLRARLEKAGLPVVDAGDGAWSLQSIVRDHLRMRGRLEGHLARAAASSMAGSGHTLEAARLLLRADDANDAATILAGAHPAVVERFDMVEYDAAIGQMPAEVIRRHPQLLLNEARLAAPAALIDKRSGALHKALEAAPDPRVRREVEAETAFDLARDGLVDEAEGLADEILASSGSGELHARARAHFALAMVGSWRGAEADIEASRTHLDRALALSREIPLASLESAVLLARGYRVLFDHCEFDAARADLTASAALAPGRRHRAVILTFHADVAGFAGLPDEAEHSLGLADAIGTSLGDERILGYVAWERMKNAARRGDLDAVLRQEAMAEEHGSDWFAHPTGMLVLSDAAEACDQLGDLAAASRFLERALERMRDLLEPEPTVLLAQAALEARHGDAQMARALLEPLREEPGLPRRMWWRPPLLDAFAAHRLALTEAPALAVEAFEVAARLGVLPVISLHESEVVGALAGVAAAAGSAAARLVSDPPVDVQVLGHFAVHVGGRVVTLPPGQPASLVKILSVEGRPLHVEQVIDRLWPEAAADEGRKLLRNVLYRLQRHLRGRGYERLELVERTGDTLRLGAKVDVDRSRLGALARLAASGTASVEACRAVLARLDGEPLPEDRYEEWMTGPRNAILADIAGVAGFLADGGDMADLAIVDRLRGLYPDYPPLLKVTERLRFRVQPPS